MDLQMSRSNNSGTKMPIMSSLTQESAVLRDMHTYAQQQLLRLTQEHFGDVLVAIVPECSLPAVCFEHPTTGVLVTIFCNRAVEGDRLYVDFHFSIDNEAPESATEEERQAEFERTEELLSRTIAFVQSRCGDIMTLHVPNAIHQA